MALSRIKTGGIEDGTIQDVDINDVGGSALYLLSDLSAAVTGEIHYVDAGYNKVGMPNPKNIT